MTSDLKSATLITLVSMCILPPMASEAMEASFMVVVGRFISNLPKKKVNWLETYYVT